MKFLSAKGKPKGLVIQYGGKQYAVRGTPITRRRLSRLLGKRKYNQLPASKIRKLIVAFIPTFPQVGVTDLELLPVYLFIENHINKALGAPLGDL